MITSRVRTTALAFALIATAATLHSATAPVAQAAPDPAPDPAWSASPAAAHQVIDDGAGSGGSLEPAVRIEPRAPQPLPAPTDRPQVYLAYYNNEPLLTADPDEWDFVRENLDGIWGNSFHGDDLINKTGRLTTMLRTRRLIIEQPLAWGDRCESPGDDRYWKAVEDQFDLRFDRIGVAIYSAEKPDCWDTIGGIDGARQHFGQYGYREIHALYQPQNLTDRINVAMFPTIRPGSEAQRALDTSENVVLECPFDHCVGPDLIIPFAGAMRAAHARGAGFTWFTGYTESLNVTGKQWIDSVKTLYTTIADMGLWRPEDRIVLINYDRHPTLPETNPDGSSANTVTGILHWLLTRRGVTR